MEDRNFQNPINPFDVGPQTYGNPETPAKTGYEMPQGKPVFEFPDFDQQPYSKQEYNPYYVTFDPAREETEEKKPGKSKALPIILISTGVIAALTVVMLWVLGFFHSKNGKYVWDDYLFHDMSAELTIDGDEGKILITSKEDLKTMSCEVYFEKDTVTLIAEDGRYLTGKYNRKNQVIVFEDDPYLGTDIELEKQDD